MTSSTLTFNNFCLSSYLAFRYVVEEGIKWRENVVPTFPNVGQQSQICVSDAAGILAALRDVMEKSCKGERIGILLSSGIDSPLFSLSSYAHDVRLVAVCSDIPRLPI